MIRRAIAACQSILRFRIRPVRQTYKGVSFASTLEADWAATLDYHGISWSYEPMAVRLSDGRVYRCDFWLRAQRVWLEVKGPHDLGIDKPRRFYTDLGCDPDSWRSPIVVVGREPEQDYAVVERADGRPIGINECRRCQHWTFIDLDGAWQCRICGHYDKAFRAAEYLHFQRAPRDRRRAA